MKLFWGYSPFASEPVTGAWRYLLPPAGRGRMMYALLPCAVLLLRQNTVILLFVQNDNIVSGAFDISMEPRELSLFAELRELCFR